MKRVGTFVVFVVLVSFCISAVAHAGPKILNCEISPKEIAFETQVTISFDYEGVKGGLKDSRLILSQKKQMPGDKTVYTRISNWQRYLSDLSSYQAESGRFEKKFQNPDRWTGPDIELTYELRIIDKDGKESDTCTTKIKPK